jgi:hypothetical protein
MSSVSGPPGHTAVAGSGTVPTVGNAPAEQVQPTTPAGGGGGGGGQPAVVSAGQIAGLSVLKGLILYAAVFAFAALYVYFIVKIFQANPGKTPAFDGSLVSAAAALAGVLGSAFALEVGTPTDVKGTNAGLSRALAHTGPSRRHKALAQLWRVLSLDPRDTRSASWPKTFGIWAYAVVGSTVAIAYVCNQNETPGTIKALGVAFGGYVITLVTAAYGVKAKGNV